MKKNAPYKILPDIVVTGVTGFVGQKLGPKLISRYSKGRILFLVWNKDNTLKHTSSDYLKRVNANIKYVDLLEPETLTGLPKSPKLIINLAAKTDTSSKNHEVNSKGVKNLYKAFGKLDGNTLFIQMGTMVAAAGRNDCRNPIDETTPDYPTNEYTRTKVIGEKYLLDRCKEDNFRLIILRPNTIYGKKMREGSLFKMLTKMILEKSLIVRFNWPGKSALIHVDDVVKYILYYSQKKTKPGVAEKYLLYSENLTISQISKMLHKELKMTYKPIQFGKQFWSCASYLRRFIPIFENFLTAPIYNSLWRLSIIVDNTVFCQTQKAKPFKKKLLASTIKEVL